MRIKKSLSLLYLISLLLLSACTAAASPEEPATLAAVAAPTPTRLAVTCADVDAYWGSNWPAAIAALEALIAAGQICGDEPLPSKLYATRFNYAASLEEEGDLATAIDHYQAAFNLAPQRPEALDALTRLAALPPPTPPACRSDAAPRPDPAVAAAPDLSRFVTTQGAQLQLDGRPFIVRGLNYYPRHAPWERFLSQADPAEMAQELDLIRTAGFNTLRLFVWYQPLFTCQPDEAIPNETAFARLDTLFQLAAERDLKLILTLNDLPDLRFRPLYTDWDHYDAQTVYIVRRYRHQPALLAWDVRNGGDIDSGPFFDQADILAWLAHITALIREHDPHHLLTAGWDNDPRPTAPYVDILAVQHWADPADLPERVETYRRISDKPLLLLSTGFHSWAEAPDAPQNETQQAPYLSRITQTAEAEGMAGWLIWTAFDFVPAPGQPVTAEHRFGLWRTDLAPKPVLEALSLRP